MTWSDRESFLRLLFLRSPPDTGLSTRLLLRTFETREAGAQLHLAFRRPTMPLSKSSHAFPVGPICLALVIAIGGSALASEALALPDEPGSATLAKQLVKLMADRQLSAYAVEDPAEPGRFTAVLAYPDVQVLVVAGRSTSADYLRTQMKAGKYMDVYSGLNASAVAETKLFIHDMGCDGISRGGESVDVMYERGTERILFDGNGRASGLAKAAYEAKAATANQQYGRLLQALLDGLRATGS
jgi:hypothetical protein